MKHREECHETGCGWNGYIVNFGHYTVLEARAFHPLDFLSQRAS